MTKAVASVQQWVNFSVATPNQDAIAQCLQQAQEPYLSFPTYYDFLADDYLRKRNLLVTALKAANIRPIVPQGGFFIMGDTSNIEFDLNQHGLEITDAMPTTPMPRDWAMSRWMTKEVGVTAIPPSAFYEESNVHLAQHLLRFAYCKGDETIMEAQKRFQAFFQS